MKTFEQTLVAGIAKAGGPTATQLGLRFDRVVLRLVGGLRGFAADAVPKGTVVFVAITAPLRLPAQTELALEKRIGLILKKGPTLRDRIATIHGNRIRLRVRKLKTKRGARLIGLVHNPDVSARMILDLVELKLRDFVAKT